MVHVHVNAGDLTVRDVVASKQKVIVLSDPAFTRLFETKAFDPSKVAWQCLTERTIAQADEILVGNPEIGFVFIKSRAGHGGRIIAA